MKSFIKSINIKAKSSFSGYFLYPFRHIAGGKSLLWGFVILTGLTLSGYASSTWFDGVLDIHYGIPGHSARIINHVVCVFGSWAVTVVIFYLTARILSGSSIRLIDFAGTLALAKAPQILAALAGFIPGVHFNTALNPNDKQALMMFIQEHVLAFMLSLLVATVVLIWFVIWTYNAYSVSGNLKGGKGILSFIIALLVAEIISKILIIIVL
jgi:hypothetical protein